ncbi:NAD-binding protein, partial [Synechococcus sp. BA-132 BA5]
DSIKVFTIIMMLIGTAVIGIFYAILNDFILGSRLRNFWDATRVPHRNHIVVCGLGSVGVQTALQLVSYGYEVLVIERDLNNRFLDTVRSHGIPVIHGDASLPTTLKAANLEKAEKAEIKAELKSLEKEARALRGTGLYISTGALIIIIILLIILL